MVTLVLLVPDQAAEPELPDPVAAWFRAHFALLAAAGTLVSRVPGAGMEAGVPARSLHTPPTAAAAAAAGAGHLAKEAAAGGNAEQQPGEGARAGANGSGRRCMLPPHAAAHLVGFTAGMQSGLADAAVVPAAAACPGHPFPSSLLWERQVSDMRADVCRCTADGVSRQHSGKATDEDTRVAQPRNQPDRSARPEPAAKVLPCTMPLAMQHH